MRSAKIKVYHVIVTLPTRREDRQEHRIISSTSRFFSERLKVALERAHDRAPLSLRAAVGSGAFSLAGIVDVDHHLADRGGAHSLMGSGGVIQREVRPVHADQLAGSKPAIGVLHAGGLGPLPAYRTPARGAR